MTKKADLLKQQVPDFISGSTLMNNIYEAQGSALDELYAYNEDTFNQLFIETATWGLTLWEKFCGLKTDTTLSYEVRRAKIRAHMASHGTVNKETIKNIAKDFGFSDLTMVEDYAPYIVKFIFDNSDTTAKQNINDLIETLRNICPAHIDFMYVFMYKTWKDIQSNKISFDDMQNYQWREYTTDYDSSKSSTPNINLKKWTDEDLFSMSGFNHNFNQIDKAIQNHNHNGINSPKIQIENTHYSNNETNNNLYKSIKRVNDRLGTKIDKFKAANNWGIIDNNAIYDENMDLPSYKEIREEATQVRLDILQAMRDKGMPLSNETRLLDVPNHIYNISTGITPEGTSTPEYVKQGKSYISKHGVQTGTAKTISGVITPGINDINISGYTDLSTIKAEPNLISSNIKSGVSLWAVEGSYKTAKYPQGAIIKNSDFVATGDYTESVMWKNQIRHSEVECAHQDLIGSSELRRVSLATGQVMTIWTNDMLKEACGVSKNHTMKVTHISDLETFIFQDVVNKNLCCLMRVSYNNDGIYELKLIRKFEGMYAIGLDCRNFAKYEPVVTFKKQIVKVTNIGTELWHNVFNGEILENSTTIISNDTVAYIKVVNGRNIVVNSLVSASNTNWEKDISTLYSDIEGLKASCLMYDVHKNTLLIGANSHEKASINGELCIKNYPYLISLDIYGSGAKLIDAFRDVAHQSYLGNGYKITAISRHNTYPSLLSEEKYTLTMVYFDYKLDNDIFPEDGASVIAIVYDSSVNYEVAFKLYSLSLGSYKDKTKLTYANNSFYGISSNETGIYYTRIRRRQNKINILR